MRRDIGFVGKNRERNVKMRRDTGVALCLIALFVGLGLGIFISDLSKIVNANNELKTVESVITKLNPKIDSDIVYIIANSVIYHSKQNNIPWEFVIALINVESTFNPLATSSSGAIGLMQIMKKYHEDKIGGLSRYEIYHIDNNIRIGIDIIDEYLASAGGDPEKALHSYFGIHGGKYVRKVLNLYTKLTMDERNIGGNDGNI